MNKKSLKHFEDLLLSEREEVLKRLKEFREKNKHGEASADSYYDQHMAELGSDAREREKSFYFASAEGRQLQKIDQALARIKEGHYGICESCQGDIDTARLEFVPSTDLCITCSEKEG